MTSVKVRRDLGKYHDRSGADVQLKETKLVLHSVNTYFSQHIRYLRKIRFFWLLIVRKYEHKNTTLDHEQHAINE